MTDRARFVLRPPGPYSLVRSAARLHRFCQTLDRMGEDGVYRRLVHLDGRLILVVVEQDGRDLIVRLRGEGARRAGIRRAAERFVLRGLGAGRDLRPFYRRFRDDPLLAGSIESEPGLQVVGPPTVFEAILTAVFAQQVNLTFAYSIRRALSERYGEKLQIGGEAYLAFPTPERLARVGEARLRGFKLSRMKAIAVDGVAKGFARGELDEEALDALPDEDVIERLTAYKGIGRWTAEIALMRGLGRPDVFPAGDLTIIKKMARAFLEKEDGASEAEMRAFSERWSPHRSTALLYAYGELARRRAEG